MGACSQTVLISRNRPARARDGSEWQVQDVQGSARGEIGSSLSRTVSRTVGEQRRERVPPLWLGALSNEGRFPAPDSSGSRNQSWRARRVRDGGSSELNARQGRGGRGQRWQEAREQWRARSSPARSLPSSPPAARSLRGTVAVFFIICAPQLTRARSGCALGILQLLIL